MATFSSTSTLSCSIPVISSFLFGNYQFSLLVSLSLLWHLFLIMSDDSLNFGGFFLENFSWDTSYIIICCLVCLTEFSLQITVDKEYNWHVICSLNTLSNILERKKNIDTKFFSSSIQCSSFFHYWKTRKKANFVSAYQKHSDQHARLVRHVPIASSSIGFYLSSYLLKKIFYHTNKKIEIEGRKKVTNHLYWFWLEMMTRNSMSYWQLIIMSLCCTHSIVISG